MPAHYVTEESGVQNLMREGKPADKIHFVGHVMIDNLLYQNGKLDSGAVDVRSLSVFPMKPENGSYAFLTLHRPSNVDNADTFRGIIFAINEIADRIPIVFPVHRRTRKMAEQFGISFSEGITLLPPLGFRESLFPWKDAEVVLTDSGGLQEETTALRVPCVTIRDNTERPITVDMGTNVLAGTTREGILRAYRDSLEKKDRAAIPPKWDGRASERIWEVLLREIV
jgi:UDP-N-acetylglucosamine 2-epimerase (non-hydrolysing)